MNTHTDHLDDSAVDDDFVDTADTPLHVPLWRFPDLAAMTLALEEQRKRAEETLTLLAAAQTAA